MGSPLRGLPVVSWSTRFDHGEVTLAGRLVAPFVWAGMDPAVPLPVGSVRVRFTFSGVPRPAVGGIDLTAVPDRPADRSAARPADRASDIGAEGRVVHVEILEQLGRVDGQFRLVVAPMDAVAALLDHLSDPSIHVRARPTEGLLLKLAPSVEATIPANAAVVLEAETRGPPERPRLVRPLVVSVGGTGLSIRLPGARWVSALASVAIRRASLAPDGAVELTGRDGTPLDRAVGVGLRQASHHLSEMVRNSPRFASVREFLRED